MKECMKIALIETLDLEALEIAKLLLVFFKKIPATVIESTSIMPALKGCGLKNEKFDDRLCISANHSDAQLLHNLLQLRKQQPEITPANHIAYGALMGFPMSAIEGYVHGESLPRENYPFLFINEPLLLFNLSKKDFRD